MGNKNPGETSKHTAPKLPGKASNYSMGGAVPKARKAGKC